MRRKDREVTDNEKIKSVMEACQCCRLGLYDKGEVYIVPLSFGYTEENGQYRLYFHSAREGRKLNLMAGNKSAGFEMDTGYQLIPGDRPCAFTARYQSIIGTGEIRFIEDDDEKAQALSHIMRHYSKKEWTFSLQMLQTVQVFQLTPKTLTCKSHL